jgi:hypothetical protein
LSGNIITANNVGIEFHGPNHNNFIFHNSFVDNTIQIAEGEASDNINIWDNGYPSGGNYWSDYTGNDTRSGPYQNETGSDGIGDTPYIIDASNRDNYPLMNLFAPNLIIESLVLQNEGCNVYANDTFVNGTGYCVPVEICVENRGQVSSDSFNASLTIYWINGSIQEDYVEWGLSNLDAGENGTLTFYWHPTHTGYYNLIAVVDCNSEVAESDESDNTSVLSEFPVALIGDANGDHIVNIIDAVIISLAWNSHPSESNWNIKADLNHDGVVNVSDGVRVGLHWAQTW